LHKIIKKWTEEEHEFMRKQYSTHGFTWTANKLNRPENSIRHKASRLGLKAKLKITSKYRRKKVFLNKRRTTLNHFNRTRKKYGLTPQKESEMIDLYLKEHKSLQVIRDKFGLKTTSPIRTLLKLNGYKIRNKDEAMKLFCGSKNVSHRPEVKKKISIGIRKHLRLHPEKATKRIMRLGNRKTKIENIVEEILIKNQIKYVYNPTIKTNKTTRFPDFKINNLIIECDGLYWHKDREKQTERDREFLKMGYSLLHFSDRKILKHQEVVERCILQKLKV